MVKTEKYLKNVFIFPLYQISQHNMRAIKTKILLLTVCVCVEGIPGNVKLEIIQWWISRIVKGRHRMEGNFKLKEENKQNQVDLK